MEAARFPKSGAQVESGVRRVPQDHVSLHEPSPAHKSRKSNDRLEKMRLLLLTSKSP